MTSVSSLPAGTAMRVGEVEAVRLDFQADLTDRAVGQSVAGNVQRGSPPNWSAPARSAYAPT